MRVQVTRRGGVAGIALRATIDTTELPEDAAARVESALRGLPWGRPPPKPGLPDRFSYEFAMVEEGDDRSVVLGELELPAGLRPVLDLLAQHGQVRPASS